MPKDLSWLRRYHAVIVVAAMLVLMISNGLTLSGLGPMRKAYAAELGWTPAQVASGDLITFVLLGLLAPLVGPLIDRFGTRVLMQLGLLALAAGYGLYGDLQSLGQLYAIHALFAVVLALCGMVPVVALVSRWFEAARGTAIGLALVGSSVASFVFPPLAERWLIPAYGWREAFGVLAWVAIGGCVLVVLLVRSAPADSGRLAYGAQAPGPLQAGGLAGLSVREALRTRAFWILCTAAFMTFFAMLGTLNQLPFFLGSLGLAELSGGYAAMLGSALVGKFLFGFLADRLGAKPVFLGNLAVMALGAALLALAQAGSVYAALAVFGAGWGGLYTLLQLLTVQSFGLKATGRILGWIALVDCIGGGLGGVVIAEVAARSGSYAAAYGLLTAMITLALLAATRLPPPWRADAPNGSPDAPARTS